MTLFDFNQFLKIKEPGWALNTLKPPLKIKDVLQDFKFQWRSYCNNNLPFFKSVIFLVLRVFQRFAYNFGWLISSNNFKKNNYK